MRNEVLDALPTSGRETVPNLLDCMEHTRADALAAHDCIHGLLEMLDGCAPDHKLTASCMQALLMLPRAYLDNVVDGLGATGDSS